MVNAGAASASRRSRTRIGFRGRRLPVSFIPSVPLIAVAQTFTCYAADVKNPRLPTAAAHQADELANRVMKFSGQSGKTIPHLRPSAIQAHHPR
jgi:hypothetical protein